MASIENLPDDIFIQVMSYLSLSGRMKCRLVNKRWNELSYSASLIKNDITYVDSLSDLNSLNFNRKYFNIKVKKTHKTSEKPDNHLAFWKKFGKFIRSVNFRNVLYPLELWEIFVLTPNIEEVVLHGKMERCEKIPNWLISEIPPKNFTKLVSLEVYGFDNTIVPLLNFLTQSKNCALQKLAIGMSNLENEVFTEIFEVIGNQLSELILDSNKKLTQDILPVIEDKFPNLKTLKIINCWYLHNIYTMKCYDSFTHQT